MTKKIGIAGLAMVMTVVSTVAAAQTAVYETGFADSGKDWTAVGNATVSEIARRPGGKSLLLRQTKDEEANSAWLGPVLKNPGKPLRVTLWAADNYDVQRDFSYAAAFELVPCDKDGKWTPGNDATPIPWDDKRQDPVYHHNLTRDGLRWTFYSGPAKPLAGEYLRVRLFWPKTMARGECYFTDVQVAEATPAADAAAVADSAKPAATGRLALEISTPVTLGLYFHDDPLRFEFVLFSTDGKPVGELKQPVLRYEITDYEKCLVASGTLPFTDAKPLAQPVPRHMNNLHLSAVIPAAAAKAVGRELFLHAQVLDGDTLLAEDTIPYGVVNPRPANPADHARGRFITMHPGGGIRNTESKHERQDIYAKMGTVLTEEWDNYGWPVAQPVKDGPITIKPGPEFPKLIYCPNVEQTGRSMGAYRQGVPEWAVVDDPLRPGKKTFDVDAYVNYIVAYIRANRHRIVQVVPSGLERVFDARTLELHRKAYAAIKKEWPDLPVGLMLWDISNELVLKEKLYEVADFFDHHIYVSRVNWKDWDDLRAELKKRGVERRMISTEAACVGGTDQLQSARDQIAFTLDCHAHALDRILHFNMFANMGSRPRQPILRGDYKGDGFEFVQYVDRPRVSAVAEGAASGGAWGEESGGTALMPLLKALSYYNLVQNTEGADFKCVFKPSERTVAYVYARDGKTICYLFLSEPNPAITLALDTTVPYTMQDLYGRTDRVVPAGGSLVAATLDPLALLFEGEVPALYDAKTAAAALKPAAGLDLPSIARGGSATAKLTLPPLFNKAFTARIAATVDGTWPQVEAKRVTVAPGQPAAVDLPIAVAASQPAGNYTFTTRIYDGDTLVSVLKQPLKIGELLATELRGEPITRQQDPAVVVTVRSLADQPMTGRVRVENRFFGPGFTPSVMEAAYQTAPRGTAEVRFPIPREQANLTASYEMRATVADASGFTLACNDDVSFQASVKTKTPITVDGDLADWKLDELLPLTGGMRNLYNLDKPTDLSAKFYSRWDDQRLYFAAIVTDSTPVVLGTERPLWNDDNILFLLYPWTWHMGEPLNSGYYREHLGPYRGGKAAIWRVGYVPSGPANADGAQIAVRRTDTGWIYEWSYPQSALYPLEFKAGNGFRLAFSVYNQVKKDKKDENDFGQWELLTFSGFHYSILSVPSLWRQIRMVEEAGK
jgi:hypothetical protein